MFDIEKVLDESFPELTMDLLFLVTLGLPKGKSKSYALCCKSVSAFLTEAEILVHRVRAEQGTNLISLKDVRPCYLTQGARNQAEMN